MKTFSFFATFVTICCHSQPIKGDINWPEYNQQCRDDAGPPYLDDSETFPNGGKYHDYSAAAPVLQNGECPDPLKGACTSRPSIKTAFLEGPISCGDRGWYCRIMPDEKWPPLNLLGDVNFGHCNTTDNFEDAGADQDGHCHGSSKDNTYYWWIRDHWFRGYNGRLRCCCGWNDGSETPLTGGRIGNRCDYRRQVTPDENLSQCRDANEDHGLSYEGGCNSQYSGQIDSPIPENNSMCWEMSRFGFSEGFEPPAPTPPMPPTPPGPAPTLPPFPDPTLSPAPSSSPEDDDEEEEGDDEVEEEDPNEIFLFKRNRNGSLVKQTCGWLQGKNTNKQARICTKPKFNKFIEGEEQPASQVCLETCSEFCLIEIPRAKFFAGVASDDEEEPTQRSCRWLDGQNEATREILCDPDFEVDVETVFARAYAVCTDTCGNCT